MNDCTTLKLCLDRLSADYGPQYLDSDPLGLVHEYTDDRDREIIGFITSALSYGKASQIRKSVRTALAPAGKSPADFAANLAHDDALEIFHTFKHRWTGGSDIAFLFLTMGKIMRSYGSLGALVKELDNPDEMTVSGVMSRLSDWIQSQYDDQLRGQSFRKSISYLVPSPSGKSACKRLAMFFRWMVRGPDGLDFGIWDFISPARLVIPVDRHIARMGQLLGLTSRSSADWKMALEITESLRCLDPDDPVRYDFALVRPGILGECTPVSPGDCTNCALCDVCLEAK